MTKNTASTGPARAGRKPGKKPESQEPLRLQRIAVKGLFGLYDHDIELRIEDRVTILHGPNGVGKTALLKLVAGFLSGNYEDFARYPFAKLTLDFSSRESLVIRHQKTDGMYPGTQLNIRYTYEKQALGLNAEVTVVRYRSGSRLGGILDKPGSTYDTPEGIEITERTEGGWLQSLRKRIQVHVIEAQRLLRRSERSSPDHPWDEDFVLLPAVHQCATDLASRIRDALADYGRRSQSLDQSFPQRLLQASKAETFEKTAFKRKMADLDRQRSELQQIGLLDPAFEASIEAESLDDLAPEQATVMSLYIDDTQKKLAALEDLAQRITILLDNVNSKFKHKSIRIDREKGFVALGHDGSPLDPDALSSGEQHELVLLYDLLFRVQPGTLVLIDEPELSLHVGWRKRFLPDLLEIVKVAEIDAIIATHSPFIVGDRSDLMVPLAAEIDA